MARKGKKFMVYKAAIIRRRNDGSVKREGLLRYSQLLRLKLRKKAIEFLQKRGRAFTFRHIDVY